MAGPWEQYASPQEASGPWDKFTDTQTGDMTPIQKKAFQAKYPIGAEGISKATTDIVGDFNPLTQTAVGAKAGWDNMAYWFKQRLGMDLTPDEKIATQANKALLKESPPAVLGNIVTNLAATGAPAAGAYKAIAGGVGKIPYIGQLIGPTVAAGATSGVLNTMQPTDDKTSTLDQLGQGALGGAVVDTVLRGGGRLLQPITQSAPVQNLLNKEIVPSIGQSIGGWANKMEEKAQSIPFIGDIISGARNRARDELNTAALNLEIPSNLPKVTQTGHAGVDQADDILSQGYKNLYGMGTVTRDRQLLSDLQAAAQKPAIPLSDEYVKTYNRIIKRDVLDRLPNGSYPLASQVKTQIEADLGKAIRGLGWSGQEGALKESLMQARQAVRDLAGRQAGVDQAARAALDKGYANVRDVASAAGRAEVSGGVPTPLQLVNAAKEGTRLEQLGRDAQQVLGNRVPNSGTTDRYLQSLLIGGAGALASGKEVPGANMFGPAYWLALGASPLLYSRGGTRLLTGDLPGIGALQRGGAGALNALRPYLSSQGGLLYQQ